MPSTRRIRYLIALTALLLIVACSPVTVRIDQHADFVVRGSPAYALWGTEDQSVRSLDDQRLETAANNRLQSAGWSMVPREQATLLVRARLTRESRWEARALPRALGSGLIDGDQDIFWHPYDMEWIVIELIDPDTLNALWEGRAGRRGPGDSGDPERIRHLAESVDRLLDTLLAPSR